MFRPRKVQAYPLSLKDILRISTVAADYLLRQEEGTYCLIGRHLQSHQASSPALPQGLASLFQFLWEYGVRSTPQNAWRDSWRVKFRNISPRSRSAPQVSDSIARRTASMFGNAKVGAQSASFTNDRVQSYTRRISPSALGTAKTCVRFRT
jgi:hypothetical protein